MSKFIAAMDHSGGSTGGVLERYGVNYTEDNKMDLVHEMRMRMVGSPDFNSDNIWAAILYQDTVQRGMVPVLNDKGIQAYLKIDSGCNEDGTLKDFDLTAMMNYAIANKCTGTKMRSILYSAHVNEVLDQQFDLASKIYAWELMPIIEPEVPIDHEHKQGLEIALLHGLRKRLAEFKGKCILKLTLPEQPNMYKELTNYRSVHKIVGLSGGYTTEEACRRLKENDDMSASFSRALSQDLFANQTDEEFDMTMAMNIQNIVEASS